MSTIHVEHKHPYTRDEAMDRARKFVQDASDKMGFKVDWNGPTAKFKGTGFSGEATVKDNLLVFDLDLSLMLRPLKSKIEERIHRTLEKRFT
jgi:putative polyhydroxyalkanoate system protein